MAERNARYAKENGQHGEELQAISTGQAGIGQEGWDHSPLEGEWTHLVGEVSHA
jgi:hypothetical protein